MKPLNSMPDYVRDLPVVALFTLTIYVFLILAFRLVGRRQLGQLTVIDLVIILIMGSAVETAMVNGNLSLPAGLISASTLLLANAVVNALAHRFNWFRRLVSPPPVLLISQGQIIEEHLKRQGLTHDDLLEAIRERGVADIKDVKFAVLEEDGEINVVTSATITSHTVAGVQ
jgi:uncharacterized membrane protein YcaP (DUF421 family)